MAFISPSMSNVRLTKFLSKGIKFSFLTASFYFQGYLRLFKGRREAVKKRTWISFVPSLSLTTKYSEKVNSENKSLVTFYCFLFFLESVKETTHADILMLRIIEILQQKGTNHKNLLIVSCSIYSFFIWISESDSFLQDSIRYLDAQNCWNISTKMERSKDASYCFLFHIFVSYLSLWNKSDSFLQVSTRYVDAQNCWNILKKRDRS